MNREMRIYQLVAISPAFHRIRRVSLKIYFNLDMLQMSRFYSLYSEHVILYIFTSRNVKSLNELDILISEIASNAICKITI